MATNAISKTFCTGDKDAILYDLLVLGANRDFNRTPRYDGPLYPESLPYINLTQLTPLVQLLEAPSSHHVPATSERHPAGRWAL
jgi:hypothetical protein